MGCDKNSIGAANWVNKNIVNVAATRAKFRLYLVGDKTVWTCKPVKVARECTDYIIKAVDLDSILLDAGIERKSVDENTSQSDKIIMRHGVCPKCGKMLVEKKGRFGKFLGCSGFPECKYTKSY